jgi:hypothetical protein
MEVWEEKVYPLICPNEIDRLYKTCYSCFMFNNCLRAPAVVALFGGAQKLPFDTAIDLTIGQFATLRAFIRDPIVNGTYAHAPHVHVNKCPLFPTRAYPTKTLGGLENATKLHDIFKSACKSRNKTLQRSCRC